VVGGADLFLVLCGGILRVYLHLGLPTHRMLPSAKGEYSCVPLGTTRILTLRFRTYRT
jgi:hypothetical protein